MGLNVRFISKEEVFLAIGSGHLIKVNIKSKKSQIIFRGADYDSANYTYWAQSKDFFLVKSSKNNIKLIDLQFKEKSDFRIENRVRHVLHTSNNFFLVLADDEAYKINGDTLLVEKFQLEQTPKIIYSGTALGDSYIFLHVQLENKNSEGRVYDLEGKLTSQIVLSVDLK